MLDHRSLLKDDHDTRPDSLNTAVPPPMPSMALIAMLTIVIHDAPPHPVETI